MGMVGSGGRRGGGGGVMVFGWNRGLEAIYMRDRSGLKQKKTLVVLMNAHHAVEQRTVL